MDHFSNGPKVHDPIFMKISEDSIENMYYYHEIFITFNIKSLQ